MHKIQFGKHRKKRRKFLAFLRKMPICGHQFHGGDESDWILCTSASCLDGSTTATRILKELFKKHCRSLPKKPTWRRVKPITDKPQTNNHNPKRRENEELIVTKITKMWSLENFDESKHLNGCPLKWLYNKKLLERNNKTYKLKRVCTAKPVQKEEGKRERSKNVRDKTPMEVKIHKINLIEKYTNNIDEFYPPFTPLSTGKSDMENHRKKLAAKLNWKLHDETQNDTNEQSSDVTCRINYLPPRPLLGLKPLLSVLLAPHQETNCCSLADFQNDFQKRKKPEPSLTIQSLDLSCPQAEAKPQLKATNKLRWGTKSTILSKKLQIPNPITIKLEPKNTMANPIRIICHNPPLKKSNEKIQQQPKSLTSLYYELKNKTDYRYRDLAMEEGQFKIRKFFHLTTPSLELAESCKINPEKWRKMMETSSGDESELNLICERIRFFDKSARADKKEGREEKRCD